MNSSITFTLSGIIICYEISFSHFVNLSLLPFNTLNERGDNVNVCINIHMFRLYYYITEKAQKLNEKEKKKAPKVVFEAFKCLFFSK